MRRIVLGLGIFFLALSAIAATAVAFRFPLAALALRHGLARAGFSDSRFTIERLTFREVAIADVEAGEALRARRIEVALDLRRLPRLPIEKVRIVDADVKLPLPSNRSVPA